MRRNSFIFLLLSIILSCSEKDNLPKGILPKPKMRDIIWDMTRTSEFLNTFVFYRDTSLDKTAESKKWFEKVYQLHQTNEGEFDRSYSYYQARPLLMKEILDSLSKRIVVTRPPRQGIDSTNIIDSIKKRTPPPFRNEIQSRIVDSIKKKRIQKKVTRID